MSHSPNNSNKNKRKYSHSSSNEIEETTNNNKTTMQPPIVALPPPLMQYPNGQIVYYQHNPHQQQTYYYHIPSPQQHPFSPVLIPQQATTNTKTPRILPKTAQVLESPLLLPQQSQYQNPPSPFGYPYAIQMSPTMIPQYNNSRNSSISSASGLGPTQMTAAATTADQREKARKVSHSAIERRRRERINDKILQLKQLIPSCAEQDNVRKMSILQSAIDYITYLKDIVKSLDEKEDVLKGGEKLKMKAQKSMLPKEVEPFTNQFSVTTTEPLKTLKPMDIIKSGTPLTPPQEEQKVKKDGSNTPSPLLPATPRLKPDETKHMSLQNILC